MSSCWGDERFEEVARGSEIDQAEDLHLAACVSCCEKLNAARRDVALLAELRNSKAKRAPSNSENALVPGYRLECEIRRGGQGVVHRAIQESTHRTVALKVLSSAGARERRRFEREIELVSRLDHPFVVALQDSGIAGDLLWYAMDLVDGRPLDEWTRETASTVRARVQLFARIASGVAHAHQRGVIHRDLKPSNVLVNAADEPRILDFGAALSALDQRERLRVTAPGEFVGTLAYAAPEQLHGSDAAIDTRTDVYALGLIFYEMLAGRPPHDRSGGVAEIVERVTALEPPPPSAHARGIDRDLDAIVAKALSKQSADRYGSAEALERDVGRYLAGEPVEARRHSAGYVLRKFVARRRKPIAAATALSVSAGALVFGWFFEHQRAERQRDEAAVVRSVMQDFLGAASPLRMGGDVRLVDVYEVLARDLERVTGASDVKAEFELTIGDTNRRLLRAAEAEPHLRKALERFKAIDDRHELQTARAENLLALVLADQSRAEAIAVAERALAIRERELGANDPLLAESRRTLAVALLSRFANPDAVRARRLLEQALDSYRHSYGDDHPDVAETKVCLAHAADEHAAKETEALLTQAIATFERQAPEDPRAIACFETYASFLQSSARYDDARAMLDRAGALAKKLFGDALATELLRRSARLEFARGEMRSSEMLSRRAIAHELRRWADRRPEDAVKLRALAYRVEEPGSPVAEPPYASAFAELRHLEGDGVFELVPWINDIALALRKLGRASVIEPMLREALEIDIRAMGLDYPVRQDTIEMLATELVDEQRGAEVVDLLEESIETYARHGDGSTAAAARTSELLEECRKQMTDGGTAVSR